MRALRQGVLADFRSPPPEPAGRSAPRGRRAALRRWSGTKPWSGRWSPAAVVPSGDPLAGEERNRERVRILLDRWGILFRELLALEGPELSWSRLSRSLRALELSGEVVAGRFFDGVPGLQFASPHVLTRLREGLPEAASWWQSAADPASLCGVDLPALKALLPRRTPGTQLVWRGGRLLAVLRRSGREIDVRVGADDPGLAAVAEPLAVALTRAFDPERGVAVESIGGVAAARSELRRAFDAFSVTREHDALRLRRRYG
jgi:ATP-dependent Lhr-like helicase